MSRAELHRTGAPKHLCQRCRDRKARFRYRGVVCADRDHTLCFECYRRETNRARAHRLANGSTPSQSPFVRQGATSSRALDQRQVAHRQRMLEHLEGRSSVAS